MRRHSRIPQITDAQPSRNEELHHREVRYALMMGFRVVCLVVATVLVTSHVPYTKYWVPFLLVGAIVIPWFAVVLANDRMPKDRHRYEPRTHTTPGQRELTGPGEPDDEARTIDVDFDA